MSDFLQQMASSSRERAKLAERRYSDDELDRPLVGLAPQGFDVIAEIKTHSPSEGALAAAGSDRLAQAQQYADGGAVAVSVLTEPTRFGGEVAHLAEIAALLVPAGVPAMRKDFLVARSQLYEARAAGASGALLITAMLDDTTLTSMLDCAHELSLFVLLEAFDEDDLERTRRLLDVARFGDAAAAGQLLVGVNTRNLRTLEVDNERLRRLAELLPPAATCVAESGLKTANDAAAAADMGYRMALVGSALMKSDAPAELLRDMLAAGRARVAA